MPAPIPGQFDKDPRVHVDKTTGKFQYEDDENGQTFEWTGLAWIPLVSDGKVSHSMADPCRWMMTSSNLNKRRIRFKV